MAFDRKLKRTFITAQFVMDELMPLFEQIRQSESEGSLSGTLCTIRMGHCGAVFHKSDSSTSSSMVGGHQADACENIGYFSLIFMSVMNSRHC